MPAVAELQHVLDGKRKIEEPFIAEKQPAAPSPELASGHGAKWVLDSGATNHSTKDRTLFRNLDMS